jgi:putative two-component system response regulator
MPIQVVAPPPSTLELVRGVEQRMPFSSRRDSTAAVAALVAHMQSPMPVAEVDATIDAVLGLCRRLYAGSRSADALPLARAALAQAVAAGDRRQVRRSATACGLLSADTTDLVGAIEYHVQALRIAMRDQDYAEMSRAWNNIGLATCISGSYEIASRCYQRAVLLVEVLEGPVHSRFAANGNLADCHYQLGNLEQGIESAQRALGEMTPEFHAQDPNSAILLRRNLVRLLVAAGRVAEAEPHMLEAVALAEKVASPRARIAADITRATFEIATERTDIALTRLDQALAHAREAPATLHDTLSCVIRAEEAAGNAARALMRLEELSHHVYSTGIQRARQHVELAGLGEDAALARERHQEQAKARLISKLEPPAQPEGWKALQRLGVSAAMRMEETGWHGMRVGALTKALALAAGMPPLQALEIGLASELHDIGMLSVPARILAKKGPLNAAERAIVERHTDAGAEVLSEGTHPRILLAREIARYHHARWDGTGYPERVSGEFIPVGARMCAITDAYDMMVCGFGGTARRSMGEALEELRRQAGLQFDPELVPAFEEMIRSESRDIGVDLAGGSGMEDFQELVMSLKEDRGFI